MNSITLPDKPQAPVAAGLDVFPKRRLVIQYAGALADTAKTLGFGVVAALVAVFTLWLAVPDIARDASMSRVGKSVVEETAGIDGKCTRSKWILVSCDARITYRPDPDSPREATVEQSFSFMGTKYNTTVSVLRSTVYPERVTTTLAIENLGSRIFTTLLTFLMFGVLSIYCFRMAWLGSQRRWLEGKAMVMTPILVSITGIDGHNNVKFTATIDGHEVKASNQLREGDTPMYVGNKGLALAVALPDSPHLILLDHDLTALAFTDLERTQLRAALS